MKKNKVACDLASCVFCRNVAKEWLPLTAINRHCFVVKRGGLLFAEGDEVKGIYFLQNGWVKVHQHWAEGKELILRFAGSGAIVGHRGLGKELHYPVSATALADCAVCFVSIEFFYATLKMNPELLLRLMQFFAEELRESEERMRNMTRLPVKARVAGALLVLEEKFGVTAEAFLDMPISRQDLSAYVGATYETVFRMLQELAEEGLIAVEGKRIGLKNRPALDRLASGL